MWTSTRRRHRGPRTRRRHRLLWVLAVFAVALTGGWIALAAAFPPTRLRAIVERRLAASFARELAFRDAKLALWPPVRLAVHGLALAEPGGLANGTALRLRALDLDLDVWALLSRRLEVKRLVLDQPALHLVLRADGSTNLDHLGAGQKLEQPRSPLDFAVRE